MPVNRRSIFQIGAPTQASIALAEDDPVYTSIAHYWTGQSLTKFQMQMWGKIVARWDQRPGIVGDIYLWEGHQVIEEPPCQTILRVSPDSDENHLRSVAGREMRRNAVSGTEGLDRSHQIKSITVGWYTVPVIHEG
jgi:hypothetical protein